MLFRSAKDYFKRKRPWIVDASVKSCSKEDAPLSSYPSGHATLGYSMGVVLSSLVPDKSQTILARAAEYAYSRLVCGMHFRADVEAGQVLGTLVGVALLHNAKFRDDYEAAAMELKMAGLTQ